MGATATYGPKKMLLDRPVRFFLPMPLSSGPQNLNVLALDAGGRPVADGTMISLSDPDGKNKSKSHTRDGKALFIRKSAAGAYVASSGPCTDTLTFDSEGPVAIVLTIAVDNVTRDVIPRAVLRFADGNVVTGDSRGKIRSAPNDTTGAIVYAPGYEPAPLEHIGEKMSDDRVLIPITTMTPLYGGALHGKKIVIDPAGGGTDDAGRGEEALRGATVNLRLARELEKMLTEGGALVVLTRRGEEPLSDQNRIFRANRVGADLAIGLRFGGSKEPDAVCTVYHYPGSVTGTAVADTLASGLSGTPPCESFVMVGSSDLFLQQTNCPAIVLSGGSLADPDTETILGSSRWILLEAEAIMRSLVGFFGDRK